jgi:thiamine kinase-like enzyme
MNPLLIASRVTSAFNGKPASTYTPLKGGRSQATLFHFEVEKHSYVLRLFPPSASPLTRLHQSLLAKQAGKIGVGPKVLFVDTEGLIMEHIKEETFLPKNFEKDFALFLQKLHGSKELFPHALSPFQRFRHFSHQKGKKLPPQWPQVALLMEEFEDLFKARSPFFVPAHLDLTPGNILHAQGRFFLVDWVNGGLSDPYFDLGPFAIFNGLKDSQIQLFLTHYLNRAPTLFEERLFWIGAITRLFVIAAAFLSGPFPPYDPLPTFADYLQENKERQSQRTAQELGFIFYRHGLALTCNHL